MYYPLQIPYILNQAYADHMQYQETPAAECSGFVLCFWEMHSVTKYAAAVRNIVVSDACIDIVADYKNQVIGFSGMSRTEFNYTFSLPAYFIGARLMPGAFHQLTGLPAAAAMDRFLPFGEVCQDFDQSLFFALPFEQAKRYLMEYMAKMTRAKVPDPMTALFHLLADQSVTTAAGLYQLMHFSPRQCQRLFDKHYGITPKMALCIVRFQKCLELLTSPKALPGDVRDISSYYDQAHFIKDFKRNLGITPLELIRHYQT